MKVVTVATEEKFEFKTIGRGPRTDAARAWTGESVPCALYERRLDA